MNFFFHKLKFQNLDNLKKEILNFKTFVTIALHWALGGEVHIYKKDNRDMHTYMFNRLVAQAMFFISFNLSALLLQD